MYILKNAFKCIGRSKGRNILILIIVLAISAAACVGLSIRQAADDAKSEALEGLSITATISYDRNSALKKSAEGGGMPEMPTDGGMPTDGEMPSFDRSQFADIFNSEESSLSLEDYQKYAEADSVSDFYYSMSVSLDGSEDFLPVSDETSEEDAQDENDTEADTDTDTESESEDSQEFDFGGFGGGGMPGFPMGNMQFGSMSDFEVIGYSKQEAMTDFISGSSKLTEGSELFEQGTTELQCIINEELALFNNISVGDKIILTNPQNEEESYEFTVTGFYTTEGGNGMDRAAMRGSTNEDPANKIYTSYAALNKVVTDSQENNETLTDEESGREFETKLSSSIDATYVFADVEAYEAFADEAKELGLSEEYTISSDDVTEYKNSISPLETLIKIAGYFLLVILGIGAVVLVVLNIFSVRERKYEIGVLTAMGMKKSKVALQFICEIFAVTLVGVMIGAVIGGVFSVPLGNALLDSQLVQKEEAAEQVQENFGGEMPEGFPGGGFDFGGGAEMPDEIPDSFMDKAENRITEINSAMNLTVVFQMLGVAVLLTLAAGAASMLFIMRYDPLKILSNRD